MMRSVKCLAVAAVRLGRFGVRRLAVVGAAAALGAGVASVGLVFGAVAPASAAPACTGLATVTCTFSYTGGSQTWTPPPGVTSASFDVEGAQGGAGNSTGGDGGRAVAT